MFNRFDQAELPVTDAFGMPFSTLRKRQVEETMPEVQLRPNDPAILAANQTNDFGMPIPEPEPRRPFVPEYQPPNPVGDLMPLPGTGRGGATTRQNIPEDDNGDRNNGQLINPLSSSALSKLQDFEAQGVPQQNPKLWQKLLALAAGAGSVVAAMNAERVRPDTQALAGMTNSILYPNEERNRARWLDQRALLRDAVRTEQTGNENVISLMDQQRKSALDQSQMTVNKARADMYTTRAQKNITDSLAAGKMTAEQAKSPTTLEGVRSKMIMDDYNSKDPVRVAAAKKALEEAENQKRAPRITAPIEVKRLAIEDELRKKDASEGRPPRSDAEYRDESLMELGKRQAKAEGEQNAANLANKNASTKNLLHNAGRPFTSGSRELTPLQKRNVKASDLSGYYLNATKNEDTTPNYAAAINAINADPNADQATKDAAVKEVQKLMPRKGSGDSKAMVDEFLINMNSGKGKAQTQTPQAPPKPTTPTPNAPPKPGTKTIIRYGKDGNPIY